VLLDWISAWVPWALFSEPDQRALRSRGDGIQRYDVEARMVDAAQGASLGGVGCGRQRGAGRWIAGRPRSGRSAAVRRGVASLSRRDRARCSAASGCG